MYDCNPTRTPLQEQLQLLPATASELLIVPQDIKYYQSGVGGINFISQSTRPDIAEAVQELSKFMSAPGTTHMAALKHVLRYLRGTIYQKLTYSTPTNKADIDINTIILFSDASFGGNRISC